MKSDGGTKLTKYILEFREKGERSWKILGNKEDLLKRTFTFSDIKEGVEYEFRVAAENKVGRGEFSKPSKSEKFGSF